MKALNLIFKIIFHNWAKGKMPHYIYNVWKQPEKNLGFCFTKVHGERS